MVSDGDLTFCYTVNLTEKKREKKHSNSLETGNRFEKRRMKTQKIQRKSKNSLKKGWLKPDFLLTNLFLNTTTTCSAYNKTKVTTRKIKKKRASVVLMTWHSFLDIITLIFRWWIVHEQFADGMINATTIHQFWWALVRLFANFNKTNLDWKWFLWLIVDCLANFSILGHGQLWLCCRMKQCWVHHIIDVWTRLMTTLSMSFQMLPRNQHSTHTTFNAWMMIFWWTFIHFWNTQFDLIVWLGFDYRIG